MSGFLQKGGDSNPLNRFHDVNHWHKSYFEDTAPVVFGVEWTRIASYMIQVDPSSRSVVLTKSNCH